MLVPTAGAEQPADQTSVGSPRARRRLPLATIAYLAIGGSVALAAANGLFGPWQPAALFSLGLATLAALVVSVWVHRPSRVWPWACIAVALALFLASGIERSTLHTMGNLSASRSLLPDLLALPGYLLLAAGLLGFSRQGARGPYRHSSVVLDGLIGALAFAALAWVFAVQPLLLQNGAPLPVTLVLIAYPSMSSFIVVVTLRIAFNPDQEHVPAYWFLVAGMSFVFVGDVVYLLADANLVHVPQQPLDLPYALAYLGAGAAAIHVSMRRLTEPGRRRPMKASRLRIAIVAIALAIPALLTLVDRSSTASDRVVLCLLMLAMTGAAVLRIIQALRTAESSEARLVHQAHHDSLTGLPNRRMMEQHLSHLLDKTVVDNTSVALLYLDLDRFKLINDTHGHSHGDELLVDVANRLSSSVRPTDLVSRIGGDEFMVVLGHVVSVSQALDLANRLRERLRAPFVVRGMTFYVSSSIGLAFASGDDPAATAEALMRDADTAMYQAKDAGRDAVAVFDESMRALMTERVELERDLHLAVDNGQLHLVYQPIVLLPRGTVVGLEALVRWTHPTFGVIGPAKFIPLAEESDLISEIGAWVLDEAVRQFAAWRRESPAMADLYVSVNLSGAQLHDDQIVGRVADALALHGLDGPSLCLELTESVVMEDPAEAAKSLAALRTLGARIAIDDFGAEYSSLAYLKRFPVTALKIDKSFVDNIAAEDSPDATLIATIVAMARALEIATVAEGVETPAQADRLTELGCDAVQGYLFSPPVTADRLPAVVASLGTRGLHLVTA